MKDLADLKSKMIDAHRRSDWELAKRLSQQKERLKRTMRQIAKCVDCGVTIQGGHERCAMHSYIKFHYGKSIFSP